MFHVDNFKGRTMNTPDYMAGWAHSKEDNLDGILCNTVIQIMWIIIYQLASSI